MTEGRKRLAAAGVPCGPVNDMRQVFDDEQVRHRGMRRELSHPTKGITPIVANPIRLSETPIEYRRAPPQLGEHTDEVLREVLAMDATELRSLRELNVIGAAKPPSIDIAGLA
jgi:crotonobetainyl-CoA:carnitine CoA-transferase CaiB-like acyl-CoA transferase